MSYAPRHRPRATSYDALVEPPRRRRPSAWLVGVAALGIIAALANAFPQQVSRAWHALRDGAHADAPARPVARDSAAPTPTPVDSVAAAPMASEPAPAPAASAVAPRRDYDPDAPMTVIRAIPPPTPAPHRVVRQRLDASASTAPASVPASPDAAIVQALRAGVLRPATSSDIASWKARNGQAGKTFDEHTRHMRAYLVTGDFTIPDGLSGANAVLLILRHGAPHPRGNQGHSPILDMQTGACVGGMICNFVMSDD